MPGFPTHATFALMGELVWINGRVCSRQDAVVSAFDHGFLYGDSIYETIRTSKGRPFLLDRHLKRLQASAEALHLQLSMTPEDYRQGLQDALAAAGNDDSVIRIIVTRGEGDIGYGQALTRQPNSLIFVRPMLSLRREAMRRGARVTLLTVRRNHPRTVSPAIKSGNLLNNILGAHEAEARGFEEGIMLNSAGMVAEGTMTNVFMVRDGVLRTPHLDAGILPGITREFTLELAREAGIPTEEGAFGPDEFLAADEAFLTGTTRGVQPIIAVDEVELSGGEAGPVTRQVMAAFDAAEERLNAED